MTLRPLLLVGLCAFALNTAAQAQDDGRRHGFWAGLGLGYGSARFSCDTCRSTPRMGGWTFSGDFGWMPSRHVRLGAEFHQWLNGLRKDKPLAVITTGTAVVSYYPRVNGGPFLEGGVGLSDYRLGKGTGDPIEPISHDTTYASGAAWGYTLGLGWTVPGKTVSFTPRVDYALGRTRTLHSPDGATVATGWTPNVLLVEAGFRAGPF